MKTNIKASWRNHLNLAALAASGCGLVVATVLLGCSAIKSLQVNPKQNPNAPKHTNSPPALQAAAPKEKDKGAPKDKDKDVPTRIANPYHGDSAGLAYFLPMGKVHIVAIRTENLVTNSGTVRIAYDPNNPAKFETNTVSIVKVITNTVVHSYYLTNDYAQVPFAPTLTYSNNTFTSNTITGPPASNTTVFHWKDGTNTLVGTLIGPPTSNNLVSIQWQAGTNTFVGTPWTNAIVNTASYLTQTTTLSNQPSQLFPTNSYYITNIEVTITTEQPQVTTNYIYNVTVSAAYYADRSNLFLLKPNRDWFHDDSASITIDNNGLLASVNGSNTDESGNIVVQLAQAAVQSFELVSGLPSGAAVSAVTPSVMSLTTEEFMDAMARPKPFSVETNDIIDPDSFLLDLIDTNKLLAMSKTVGTGDLERLLNDRDPYAEPTQVAKDIVSNLNAFIDTWKFKTNTLEKAHVQQLRRETQWLAQLTQADTKNTNSPALKQLLNRMVLEDAYAGHIKLFTNPWVMSPKPSYPQKIDIAFDPFDAPQLAHAQAALNNALLTIDNAGEFSTPAITEMYANWTNNPLKSKSGIFYRPPIPYEVRLSDAASNVVSTTVLLPNKSPILHLPMNKAPFVTAISQVTLSNGFVCSYSFSKPSSLNALASYPLVLLSSVTASLTNFIQLRLNLATGQNNLQSAAYSAQAAKNTAYLAQQNALLLSISNTMSLYNAQQALKVLTNSAAGQGH